VLETLGQCEGIPEIRMESDPAQIRVISVWPATLPHK
jgi:hypothetical protein